jgi:hypothetical protein
MTFSDTSPFSAFSHPNRFDLQIRQKKHLSLSQSEFSYSSEDDDWSIFERPSAVSPSIPEKVPTCERAAGMEISPIAFREKMVRKRNSKSTTRIGPRVEKDLGPNQCESAVWNGGQGGRCNYPHKNTLKCGRKLCNQHNKIVARCVSLGEAERDGTIIGWYDNFTTERHDRVMKLVRIERRNLKQK